jgi:hypothetical protein
MKLKKNIFKLVLIVGLISQLEFLAKNQNNLDFYEISILTVGEGESLVDAFGHTAIRIKDSKLKNDIVFNFGVYDFNSSNFYSNFVKGRPEYKLAAQNYNNFIHNYIKQKRYIVEHKLNLDPNSTKIIIDFLVEKLNDPYYIYDYLRDNCTTRAADIVIDKTNKFKDNKLDSETNHSYRDLIHGKINENSWAALGIDLCLGAIIDKKINRGETFFLPENLMNYLDLFDGDIVNRSIIYSPESETSYRENLPSPLLINFILSLIIIAITIFNFRINKWSKSLDTLIFLLTGSIGILIIYLWFFSNHFAGAQNFNFLWAFPFNFALIFAIHKNKVPKWSIGYIKLLIILIVLLVLHWITGVQKYNLTLLPIFVALLIRYLFLVHRIKKN